MQANKNAFFYVIDRITGQFISAQPFSQVTWAKGIDQKTGRPIVNEEAYYGTDADPDLAGRRRRAQLVADVVQSDVRSRLHPDVNEQQLLVRGGAEVRPAAGPHDRHGAAGASSGAPASPGDRTAADRRTRRTRRAGRVGSRRTADALAQAWRRRHRRRHDDDRGQPGVPGAQRRTSARLQRRQGREAAGDSDRPAQRHGTADHLSRGRQAVRRADGWRRQRGAWQRGTRKQCDAVLAEAVDVRARGP